jgi:hypothetical protein
MSVVLDRFRSRGDDLGLVLLVKQEVALSNDWMQTLIKNEDLVINTSTACVILFFWLTKSTHLSVHRIPSLVLKSLPHQLLQEEEEEVQERQSLQWLQKGLQMTPVLGVAGKIDAWNRWKEKVPVQLRKVANAAFDVITTADRPLKSELYGNVHILLSSQNQLWGAAAVFVRLWLMAFSLKPVHGA